MQTQLLPRIVGTSRQRSYYQRVGCLLGSMAWIYDLWDGSLDKHKVHGLVPCCGQDGYQALVHMKFLDNQTFFLSCYLNLFFFF